MKDAVRDIVGRRISGVIVKEGSSGPTSQVFLLFEDGMSYEFYSNGKINGAGGLDRGGYEEALQYLRSDERDPVFAALTDPAAQRVVDREIALGWIRSALRNEAINLNSLRFALKRASDAGFDWRGLYQEAHSVRPHPWPQPPVPESVVPE